MITRTTKTLSNEFVVVIGAVDKSDLIDEQGSSDFKAKRALSLVFNYERGEFLLEDSTKYFEEDRIFAEINDPSDSKKKYLVIALVESSDIYHFDEFYAGLSDDGSDFTKVDRIYLADERGTSLHLLARFLRNHTLDHIKDATWHKSKTSE